MAVISSGLWQLVNKMTPKERLYFRRDFNYYSINNATPLYLKVFDIISKQKNYDEASLLKKLSPELTAKNISYTKHYLFENICESLLTLHNRYHAEAALQNEARLIKIFREKNMIPQAVKLCKRLLHEATMHDNNLLYQQVMQEYRKMLLYQVQGTGYEKVKSIFDTSNEQLQKFSKLLEYESLYYKSLIFRRKSHFKLNAAETREVDSLLQHPLIKKKPVHPSFLIDHYYKMTKATLLYLKGDDKAATIALENIDAWLQDKTHIEYEPENYLEALYLFNYTGVQSKIYKQVERVMLTASQIELPNYAHQYYCETIQHLALMRIYHKMACYDKVSDITKLMKKKINLWQTTINDELSRTMYLSLGISCFVLGEYDDAFYYIKTGILYFNDHTREEHFSFAYLFLMLICFEKKDYVMFDNQYTNTYNYFYRQEKPLPFEKLILQALNRAIKPIAQKEKIEIFNNLLNELDQHQHDRIQQSVFQFFNVPRWLESKIQNIPYRKWVEITVAGKE